MNVQEMIEIYNKIYSGESRAACPIAIYMLCVLYGKEIYPIFVAPPSDGRGMDIFLQNGDKMARLTCRKDIIEAVAEGREMKATIAPMDIISMIEWIERMLDILPSQPKRAA